MYDVIVVGAGMAGAAAARRFADAGRRVLVLERRGHIGGNAADALDGEGFLIHRYGPHIFHTSDEAVFRFLSRFTQWTPYEHRVKARVHGALLPVPFNLSSLEIAFGERAARMEKKLVAAYGMERKVPVLEMRRSEDAEIREVAAWVYENIFLHYTVKQWGLAPEEVDAAVTARVPVFLSRDERYFTDPHQGLPAEGYTPLFAALLDAPGIETRLDAPAASSLAFSGGEIRFAGRPFNGEVVYTGPLDELFGFVLGRLPYRALEFRFERHAVDSYQDCAVVNYTTDEEFTRITEWKKLSGHLVPGKTCILKEYSRSYSGAAGEVPCYPVARAESAALYTRYRSMAAAYPHLRLAGRLAEYRYMDMDKAAAAALAL